MLDLLPELLGDLIVLVIHGLPRLLGFLRPPPSVVVPHRVLVVELVAAVVILAFLLLFVVRLLVVGQLPRELLRIEGR